MPPGRKKYWLHALFGLLACTLVLASADIQKLRQLATQRYGDEAARTVSEWQASIEQARNLPERDKLVQANDFFNTRIRFVDDIHTWNEADYWATPLEFIGRRQGDCEDFSIAKYVTLLESGVSVDKLRITYVKAQLPGTRGKPQAHMVLAYYETPDSVPLILDNLRMDIRPASQRADLTPVFGFNGKGLWVGGAGKPASNNPGARLSRWSDLLSRMEADGIK